ncbi:HAD family hydrolase [Marivivens aquimaris]|uniref:HAD family hydrolase n=1 Tax=Marivivens aquimaris TaxID=2774876 RepID=UPI001881D5B8|nr:HAD family hydrolase [Marivivens aquimaris]
MPIQGIIFDKDGTLYDFNATWGAWTKSLLEQEAEDAAHRAALADVLGFDLESERFRKDSIVIASTSDEVSQVLLPLIPEEKRDNFMDRLNALAAVAPQVESVPLSDFLSELKGMGLKVGVATNDGESSALAHLGRSGVAGDFDFIAGYDSGFGGKPEAGQLLAFCDQVGVAPQHCVMVGDSTHDLEAGRKAGMKVVAVLTGIAEEPELAPHADAVLPSIGELAEWVRAQA